MVVQNHSFLVALSSCHWQQIIAGVGLRLGAQRLSIDQVAEPGWAPAAFFDAHGQRTSARENSLTVQGLTRRVPREHPMLAPRGIENALMRTG